MKGFVYSITSTETEDIYVGSTIKTLNQRFSHHKKDYKNCVENDGDWCWSFQIFSKCELNTIKINQLEIVEFDDRIDLRKAEQKWMDLLGDNVINGIRAFDILNKKERDKLYYEKNKDKMGEKAKRHYEKNRETIIAKAKEYALKNPDKVKGYKHSYYQKQKQDPSFIEKTKQYNEDHKESKQEYNEQYRLANRDKIKAQRSEMIRCECCDVEFIRSSLPKHNKSKKHLSRQIAEVIFLD